MGCCDNSTGTIVNNSSVNLVVETVDPRSGRVNGLVPGQRIEPSDRGLPPTTFFVVTGSQGDASGSVTLLDPENNRLDLTFEFRPSSPDGGCPCTPGGGFNVYHSDYSIDLITTVGSSQGGADVKWVISD